MATPVRIDQITPNANNIVLIAATYIFNNIVANTTSGIRTAISITSVPIKSILIKAVITNTGTMYIGNSTVSSSNGYPLVAGESVSLDISNLNTIYIDSSVNGESITYIAIN